MFFNGSRMTNYQFVDSKTSTLIQLSDIFVGVIARYHKFIDYYGDGCEEIINSFDENQLRRFKKLNALLCGSRDFNPLFVHHIDSIEMNAKYNYLIEKYR